MGSAYRDSSARVRRSTEHTQLTSNYINVTSYVAARRRWRQVPYVKMKVPKLHDVNTAPVKIEYDVEETLKDK